MASKARTRLDESLEDIDELIDYYGAFEALAEADGQGLPDRADVIFRSAVVLLVSHWEAYIEDISAEGLEALVAKAKNAAALPKEVKKHLGVELRESKNELDVWKLADDGWRVLLRARLSSMQSARNRSFSSPKTHGVSDFIRKTVGIAEIESAWSFGGYSSAKATKKLDALVELRGQIAHRGRIDVKLTKDWILDHNAFIKRLAAKTGGRINAHIKKVTGAPLWEDDEKK